MPLEQHAGLCERSVTMKTGIVCQHKRCGYFERFLRYRLSQIQIAVQHNQLFSKSSSFVGNDIA